MTDRQSSDSALDVETADAGAFDPALDLDREDIDGFDDLDPAIERSHLELARRRLELHRRFPHEARPARELIAELRARLMQK